MLTINDILVARDFSSVSDRALRHGLELAARTGATLHVVHAEVLHAVEDRSTDRPAPGDGIEAVRRDLKDTSGISADVLDNVPVKDVVERDVSPAPALLNYASDADVDVIVLGTHGRRGPSRILLGSVAERVVRRAPQPVITVRGNDAERGTGLTGNIERILVPVDFSAHSREALQYASEWARLYDAEIDVLHVVEEDLHPAFYVGGVSSIYDVEPNLDEKVQNKATEFASEVVPSTVTFDTHVATGSAASAIVEFVDEHPVDQVTLSTHGRTGLERFFLGSVTEKVVRHVPCPVLTVKAFGKSLVSPSEVMPATHTT